MLETRVATGRASVAVVTALAMVFSPAAAPAKAPPAKAAPAAPVDGGWPRAYTTASGAHVLVYQPQVASWADQRHAVACAAAAYEAKGASKPALGSLKVEADTKVSVAERLVNFSVLQVTESNFPTLKKEDVREVVAEIVQAIPDKERVIALDRVLASLDKSQILPKNAEGVKADPPKIFFSQTPAVLVNLDGEAIWSPIKENDLKFAVNTNWDLFQHEPTKTFYLRNEKAWLKATDLAGSWGPAGKLPGSFGKLPADDNWKDVKAALPGQKLSADKAPRVFVSTTPAELILLSGPPKYEPVAGTSLLWVSNTESDVFRAGKTGPVYYLVSGRWFTSPGFDGPWTFATLSLPADFQKISLEHKVGDLYYMCFQGVWFMAKSPTGPWEVTSSVPKQIYEIPTSSPANHVTYVTVVEDDSDDEWVTFAAVAAYTGVMIAWGCAVWGSGWYHPPYWAGAGDIRTTTRITRATGTAPRTTRGTAPTAAARSRTVPTAARE